MKSDKRKRLGGNKGCHLLPTRPQFGPGATDGPDDHLGPTQAAVEGERLQLGLALQGG